MIIILPIVACSRYFRFVAIAIERVTEGKRTVDRDTVSKGAMATRRNETRRGTAHGPSSTHELNTKNRAHRGTSPRSIRFPSVPSSSTETTILMGLESLLRAGSLFPAVVLHASLVPLVPPLHSTTFSLVSTRSLPLIRFQGEGSSCAQSPLPGRSVIRVAYLPNGARVRAEWSRNDSANFGSPLCWSCGRRMIMRTCEQKRFLFSAVNGFCAG